MGYRIKYIDKSLVDMAAIKEFMSQYYESTWAEVAGNIERHIGFLRDIPHGFPLYPGSDTYRKLVSGDYAVLYKVFEQNQVVEIHAIWHGKMNVHEHIKMLPR